MCDSTVGNVNDVQEEQYLKQNTNERLMSEGTVKVRYRCGMTEKTNYHLHFTYIRFEKLDIDILKLTCTNTMLSDVRTALSAS